MRRKKHTEKEVHADLISVVSVRLREGYTIRDISLTKGEQLGAGELGLLLQCVCFLLLQELLNVGPPFFRWVSAGGETGVAMETQHAHRVPGSCLVAFGPHKEDDQGGGHHGGKLRHSARHQLHPEEAHHQPVPHLRHQTLLEHASKVQERRIFSRRRRAQHNATVRWRKGWKARRPNDNRNATFALSASTKPTRCWCIFSLLPRFQRTT